MKKLIFGLIGVVVVLIVLLIAAPFFIPLETYKTQIAQAARDKTGRELTIKGDINLSLLPSIELKVGQVGFANAPGASDPQMATLKELVVALQLWPLLGGEVKIDKFVLVEPVIRLEVDKAGRPNWQFAAVKDAGKTAPTGKASGAGDGMDALKQLSLGDVRLSDGTVSYKDAQTGAAYELQNVNLKLSLPDFDSRFSADGSVVWNGEKIVVKAENASPRQLLAGKTTATSLAIESEPVTLTYKGSVTMKEPLTVAGDVDLKVPSIRSLAKWAGQPLPPGGGLEPLNIKGKVALAGPKLSFTDAELMLDAIRGKGNLAVNTAGKKPYVKARLDLETLDLNPYLPAEKPAGQKPAAASGQSGQAGQQPPPDWSDDPIDLSGLQAANADLDLSVVAIQVQKVKIGRSALTVSLKDGLLTVDLNELNLYGGKGKGKVVLDGRGKVGVVKKSFSIEGVQAEPLLTDAADLTKLEGTARMQIDIATQGRTQREMVKALNGDGAVKFTDGAIKGINLAAMARNVKSAFLDSGAKEAQKTDFAELSGTFKITNGLLRNDDLKLLNPLLRLNGKGTSDMPVRTVNYRLEPKVVATTTGQGGDAAAKGITVPVIVEGPWHDLSYKPDLAGMLKDTLADPSKALESVKGLKEGATGGAGKLLESVTKPSAGSTTPEGGTTTPDAGSTLKKLFGR